MSFLQRIKRTVAVMLAIAVCISNTPIEIVFSDGVVGKVTVGETGVVFTEVVEEN